MTTSFEGYVGELQDFDEHEADEEDNTSSESDDDISLTSNRDHSSDEGHEFNLNVSFSGGYLPNTDLNRVDKGQGNP